MRTLTGIVAVLLIQLLTACDRASPVAPAPPPPSPSPPAPTGPPAANGEKWNLMTALTSIAGPKECVAVGTYDPTIDVSHSLLTIERSGDSMHLIASSLRNPADAYEYTATMAGADFSGGATTISPGYFVCGQSRVDYRGDDHLAGRFSADEKTLTADEELVFQLTSGNVIAYHFAWTATRQ